MGVIFLMVKIGGGFWPFGAGKRAVFDSEVLATLIRIQNEEKKHSKVQADISLQNF